MDTQPSSVSDRLNPRFWPHVIEADGAMWFIMGLQSYYAFMDQCETWYHGLTCYFTIWLFHLIIGLCYVMYLTFLRVYLTFKLSV